ncbi:hypothetical protein PMI38_00832 [Pseudomonas sp. GM84]|nr:hypothetical protein PMI38_00832 [Pseudomonas sp. GM84]
MLLRSHLHLGKRTIQVSAFVVLVITGHVDDWTSEGLVRPSHTLTAHRYVSSEHHQIGVDLGRFEAPKFQMQI